MLATPSCALSVVLAVVVMLSVASIGRGFHVTQRTGRHARRTKDFLAAMKKKLSENSVDETTVTYYNTMVSYEGGSQTIQVASNETILSALERHQVDKTLPLPADLPFDCRRGNCMTCAAKIASSRLTNSNGVVRGSDGLSPRISQVVRDLGYVLTCSSKIQSDGVHLQLGENHVLWDTVYRQRLEKEEMEIATQRAMARLIRRIDERNVERWQNTTEQTFRDSGESESKEER